MDDEERRPSPLLIIAAIIMAAVIIYAVATTIRNTLPDLANEVFNELPKPSLDLNEQQMQELESGINELKKEAESNLEKEQ